MAGVGVKLKHIYEKESISANIFGVGYSILVTIAPMLFIVAALWGMEYVLGFSRESYLTRELFSCTILYIFIFALLSVHLLFSPVLARYMQDAMFEDRFADVMPSYQIGLLLTMILGCIPGIIFCLWVYFVGGVGAGYVFLGYCGYTSMIFLQYATAYLSVCKDFERMSLFYFIGMGIAFLLSLVMHYWLGVRIVYSMLFSLTVGFLLTGIFAYSAFRIYFPENSKKYRLVFTYIRKWWRLMASNFFYMFGLYVHNFVFWTHETRSVVVDSFVYNQNYDMASCLALFTNISTMVIFISRVEMDFNKRYKAHSEAIIGGKWSDIESVRSRMFRQLSDQLVNLVRMQFTITVVAYLLCIVILPQIGFAGSIMRIYPCLAAGYFILFIMYCTIHFLYYYNDFNGAVLSAGTFCVVTFLVSLYAMRLSESWYGVGVVIGAFVGWTVAYFRIRWVERNINPQIFCVGSIIQRKREGMPEAKVYDRKDDQRNEMVSE